MTRSLLYRYKHSLESRGRVYCTAKGLVALSTPFTKGDDLIARYNILLPFLSSLRAPLDLFSVYKKHPLYYNYNVVSVLDSLRVITLISSLVGLLNY